MSPITGITKRKSVTIQTLKHRENNIKTIKKPNRTILYCKEKRTGDSIQNFLPTMPRKK